MSYALCKGGLFLLRENILNRHGREFVLTRANLRSFLLRKNRVLVVKVIKVVKVIRDGCDLVIKHASGVARADSQGLLVVVRCALGFGRNSFPLCLGVNPLVCLFPLREFNQRRKPATRNRKIVKNICNVLRVELKLPRSKREPKAVVKFGSLSLRERVSQFKIVRTVRVLLSPLTNGLKAAVRFPLKFRLLRFRAFDEYFRFAMGQCQSDLCQSTAQFLNLVGRQSCFSTHPLSALLVEVNRGAILRCFILEYRQWFEWWPRTGEDGFHLGLLPWRGESSKVGLVQFHDAAQSSGRHTAL